MEVFKGQKTVVITGASGGVGSACVEHFLNIGWNVVGIIRETSKVKMLDPHPNLRYVEADISSYTDVKDAFSKIRSVFCNADLLINNASVFLTKPFIDFNDEEIDNIIDINVKGTMYCTLEFIKLKRDFDSRIINIGSVSGIHGIAKQAVYSASKHAINGFADCLGQEHGMKVTTINPGGIDTPLWNKSNPYKGDVKKLLKPSDIIALVDHIINLPKNVVLKNVTLFPNCEWH